MSVNEQLSEELHKPVIKKSKRIKAYAKFKDNVWAADLAEMKSLPSKNKNVRYLLRVIKKIIKTKIKKIKQFFMLLSNSK